MAKNNNLTDFLTNLANKFRSKLGLSSNINPQNFESLIDDVYTKGYSDAPSGGTDVSDTTANQSDVLVGKNFYNSSGTKVPGTMSNRTGATTGWCGYEVCTVQPHPADASQGLVTIPNSYNAPGYYDNTSSVTGNLANLNASNIKKGVIVGRSTEHGGDSSNSIVGTYYPVAVGNFTPTGTITSKTIAMGVEADGIALWSPSSINRTASGNNGCVSRMAYFSDTSTAGNGSRKVVANNTSSSTAEYVADVSSSAVTFSGTNCTIKLSSIGSSYKMTTRNYVWIAYKKL